MLASSLPNKAKRNGIRGSRSKTIKHTAYFEKMSPLSELQFQTHLQENSRFCQKIAASGRREETTVETLFFWFG